MKPFYQDNHDTLYCLDFRENELPDECVQMVCTSPPYWGLRKYSGEQDLIWGGQADCEHEWGSDIPRAGYRSSDTNPGKLQSIATQNRNIGHSNTCSLCGAWKGSYGLEPTPEMYVQHTIEILRKIRRVLRKDGVVFWNIGDSYAGSGQRKGSDHGKAVFTDTDISVPDWASTSLKPKDLCLIPFRVAIAAQEDGWWVRSVIIWSKPNPMPESVTDRPTESHEYILMLTKSAKYYWDADAVRETGITGDMRRPYTSNGAWEIDGRPEHQRHGGEPRDNPTAGRNIRTVWEFPTQPYPEAHFAVFPEKLPELCIKAATPEVGCCSKCGAPWKRIVEKIPQNVRSHKLTKGKVKDAVDGNNPDMAVGGGFSRTGVQFEWQVKTIGWQSTCKCNADKVPSLVLDCFAGSGTTLKVAKKLNRKAVGFDTSEEYCPLIVDRCRQQVMF